MPNPNQGPSQGRFENAKIGAAAVFAGACLAPFTEVVIGSQSLGEHMPLYTKLGLASAVGLIVLEAAGRIAQPADQQTTNSVDQ